MRVSMTWEWQSPAGDFLTVEADYRFIRGYPGSRTEPPEPDEFELIDYNVTQGPSEPPFDEAHRPALEDFLGDAARFDTLRQALLDDYDE